MRKKLLVAAFTVASMVVALAVAIPAFAQEADEDCTIESSGWVLAAPAGEGWVLVDTRVVVDKEGYTIPGTAAQHYSWTGGPLEEGVVPPPPPAGEWQANTELEPHTQGNADRASKPDGTPYVDGDFGLHYTGEPGRANWFYFQPEVEEVVVAPVTHTEYLYERETCVEPPEEVVCPEGSDFPGEVIPEGQTEEEFCFVEQTEPPTPPVEPEPEPEPPVLAETL